MDTLVPVDTLPQTKAATGADKRPSLISFYSDGKWLEAVSILDYGVAWNNRIPEQENGAEDDLEQQDKVSLHKSMPVSVQHLQ